MGVKLLCFEGNIDFYGKAGFVLARCQLPDTLSAIETLAEQVIWYVSYSFDGWNGQRSPMHWLFFPEWMHFT